MKGFDFQLHVRDRVIFECVKSSGNGEHIRLERTNFIQPVIKGFQECSGTNPGSEREVQAIVVIEQAAAGITGGLMQRDEQDSLVSVKNVFGAVAVMCVEVHDRDALSAAGFEEMGNSNGDIVEIAETHQSVASGMVTGRPHQRKSRLALKGVLGGDDGPAGSKTGNFKNIREKRCFRIEIWAVLDRRQYSCRVHPKDVLFSAGNGVCPQIVIFME